MISISSTEYPVLFSTGTYLAYAIAKQYYDDVHFAWCTPFFHSDDQPPTSDPLEIGNILLKHVVKGDRHSDVISSKASGILRGAEEKRRVNVIDDDTYDLICQVVNCAEFRAFMPVVYIINTELVRRRCIEVPAKDKASDSSIEYKITDLKRNEFQVIKYDELLAGIVKPFEGRVKEFHGKKKR